MIANSRIQELIRENKPEFVEEAIAEGGFFDMQTMSAALIDLVLAGSVDHETAATAAPNRHDFMIALQRALKEQAVVAAASAEVEAAEAADSTDLEPPAEPTQVGLRMV
jgi:Tfp pilus assembly ATPase PilU